jgi:predicted O-methyltransferase YrrM
LFRASERDDVHLAAAGERLPVLKVLEPGLRPGTLVVADDVPSAGVAEYLADVRDPANGYLNMRCPIDEGIEISCRV